MRTSDKQALFAVDISRLIIWGHEQGMKLTKGEALRTKEQQAIYVKKMYSRVKRSKHQDKLAQDLNLLVGSRLGTPEEYRKLGEHWEFMGHRWGGRFGVKKENYNKEVGWDACHFEY